MPRVVFDPDGARFSVEVAPGTSILEAAGKAGAPVGSACGGVCACSTCHVHVLVGAASLTAKREEEEDVLDKAFDVKPSSRLGCQARLEGGDVAVAITPESRKAFYEEHPDARDGGTP